MFGKYIEDNYYARFDTRSYHDFREINLNAKLDVNVDRRTDEGMGGYKQVRQKETKRGSQWGLLISKFWPKNILISEI